MDNEREETGTNYTIVSKSRMYISCELSLNKPLFPPNSRALQLSILSKENLSSGGGLDPVHPSSRHLSVLRSIGFDIGEGRVTCDCVVFMD